MEQASVKEKQKAFAPDFRTIFEETVLQTRRCEVTIAGWKWFR